MVFDASHSQGSGYSLNDLLTRSIRKCGFHTDIQKMYNAVYLDKSHWCYQMYLWNNEFEMDNPEWKVITTLIYGVKSSGNQAECAVRKTAKLMESKYEQVSEIVHKDIYVDDCMSGENTRKVLE